MSRLACAERVVIASPYEGELLGRALGATGLRVLRADGGEGGHALLATELPLAMVLGTTLFAADPAALVADARARDRSMSIYLIAELDDPVASALAPRVTTVVRRPADFEALAHTIEQLAVDAERVDEDEILEIIAEPPPLPRVPTEPVSPDAALLRADDALGELVGLGFDEVAVPRSHDGRSTIARAIDRELSQAERRLFPDQASTPAPFGKSYDHNDYEDALGDIDLDSLGIDTVPGLREVARAAPERVQFAPRPAELPLRPIQEEGSLEDHDIAELIGRIHGAAFTGALSVHRPEGEKVLYFDHGDPVGARSTLRHDHLAELLYREGKLTREQVTKVSAHAPAEGAEGLARPIALSLVDEGLLKESEVFAIARRHLEELLFSVFSLQSGEYRLGPELPPPDDRVRASTSTWALVVEGVRRKYGLERLQARLGGRDTVLSPTTLFTSALDAAALNADERRVAVLFDGHRSLGDVRTALGRGVSDSLVFGVAWGLSVLGALEHGGGAALDVRYASTVVTSDTNGERRARPRTVDAAQQLAERAIETERIAVKRAQILDADYFTILGVPRDVTDHELRRAHSRLRADFDPAQFDAQTQREEGEALAEILEVLDEALRVLSVASIRARYASHIESP